jgi:CheY-like chemotaxis protein
MIAYDGAEALRALREAPPDALLLDILMPGVDGHAVLREMRLDDQLRSLPTIIVSAPSQRDDGIIAGRVVLGQDGGLTVGQAMRLVKAGLDLLFPATGAQETDPALPLAWPD